MDRKRADRIAGLHYKELFREESVERTVRNNRIATAAVGVGFPLFGILDYAIYPSLFATFITIRLLVVGVSAVVFLLMSTDLGKRYSREAAVFEYVICCWSIIAMIHIDGGFVSPYYAGVNLVLIGFLFILPLDVVRTTVVCVLVYSGYLTPGLWLGFTGDTAIFLNNSFFLLATMGLVILSSYLATRVRWKEFVARQRLAEANEELKQLDTLKSQFFANISHEVRTPLTSVISPVQSLYQGDYGTLNRDVQNAISQVYRNALRLLDTINQMLEFARFDAGKMELRLSLVNVAQLAEETATLFREVAERKGLTLTARIDGEIPAAYLDRDKLDRILTNLIRNAIKFTDEGGIAIHVSKRDNAIVMRVSDTGMGISSDHLTRIFERFQQVNGSATRRHEGTGLGLALVKEACEIQYGSISVESKVRSGSSFTVRLPANLEQLAPDAFIERRDSERRNSEADFSGPDKRRGPRRREDLTKVRPADIVLVESAQVLSPKAEDEQVQPVPVEQPGESVIYVEDNEDLRAYVQRMLSGLGYTVYTANDGQSGWELIQRTLPDIVVSDVMMPRMDGYELLRELKKTGATQHIPIILVTAKSEEESKLEGLEYGADDYIAKPINIRELDARMRNLLTLQRYQRALAEAEIMEKRMTELAMGFSQSLELRDRYTGEHSWDVLELGTICAEELGVPVDVKLRDALLLHDIGKLGVPDRILLKPGPLNMDEWDIMREHAELGANLLKSFESLIDVSEIILSHQEHFDGTGYPRGLKGDEIPLVARIISVADAWHAMTGDRPYRKALNYDIALAELLKHKGRQFDPKVVDALVDGLLKLGAISQRDVREAEKRLR